jgi:Terpene synthase family 2, C-terminal metal binding
MLVASLELAELPPVECGRLCASAAQAQRDLQECTATYPELFPRRPFDPALASAIVLANVFCAPWLTADRLRPANRMALWAFAVDWLIDRRASSQREVRDLVDRVLAVGGGAPPSAGDQLEQFLAEIRDALAEAPAYRRMRPIWLDQLGRTLEAMAREWDWKSARAEGRAGPSVDEYLDNADNLGFTLVYVAHWIFTAEPRAPGRIEDLWTAGLAIQRVMRLLNDLCTYDRDVEWGDLNVLMLGMTRAEAAHRIAELAAECDRALGPLRAGHPRLVGYLERQLAFNLGFHPITDYWGSA